MEIFQSNIFTGYGIKYFNGKGYNVVLTDNEQNTDFEHIENSKYPILKLTKLEVECCMLYSAKMKPDEIMNILSLTKDEFRGVYRRLRIKLPHLTDLDKKQMSDIISDNFPFRIKYLILNKYDLVQAARLRAGVYKND